MIKFFITFLLLFIIFVSMGSFRESGGDEVCTEALNDLVITFTNSSDEVMNPQWVNVTDYREAYGSTEFGMKKLIATAFSSIVIIMPFVMAFGCEFGQSWMGDLVMPMTILFLGWWLFNTFKRFKRGES